MDAFEKSIEAAGVTYTFKLPSAKDVIAVDRKALELRQGLTEGMFDGLSESHNIALLSTLCKSPENVDFGDLSVYLVDQLADEVATWANSFRKRPAGKKSST